MEGAWLVSHLALWALTLVLSVVVLAHSRLLGLLHFRLGPTGAKPLADGPELGTRVEELSGKTLDGRPWSVGFPSRRDLLAIFVSPQCQSCNALLPHVDDFARSQPERDVVLISTLDDVAMNRSYVAYTKLPVGRLTYVLGARLADDLEIGGTPYALYLGRDGVVRNKGIVNHFEHLSGLAQSRGIPATVDGSEGGGPGIIAKGPVHETA